MVYYKDLKVSEGELKFFGKDIIRVGEITMTTGGSVYLITVEMAEGEPLNIVSGTIEENGRQSLLDLGDKIREVIGTDKVVVVNTVSYQDPIYTVDGVRYGWSVFHFNVHIEEPEEVIEEPVKLIENPKKDQNEEIITVN